MRKTALVLAFVFAVAFGFGAVTADTAEAAGDCFFTCSCAGEPLYCCTNSSGDVSCKPTDLWQCPQSYDC